MQGEIKPGYKQTEVGVIPKDWKVERLGTLVSETAPIRYGVVQIGPDVPGGVPIVPIKYVKKIGSSPLQRSACEIEGRFIGSRVKGSDVLISVKGTIGRVGIVPDGFEGNIAREIARIRLRSGIDSGFVASQLEGGLTQKRINEAVVGTTRLEFSIAAVRDFQIALPSNPAEQRAIATALEDADALIAALEGMIAKTRDLKQAAMQHLLTGKTRLPGFSGEWEMKRLGEVGQIIGGGTPKSSVPSYWDGGIQWCTPTDITGTQGKYLGRTDRTISEEGLKKSAATLLPAGSLLLCTRATLGEVKIAVAPICTNQGFKSLVCNPGVSSEYMYYLLLTMKQALVEKSSGSTFLEISKRDLSALAINLPSDPAEQTAIAEVLSDMDADLAALEAQAAKSRAVKQGMMQELLTGRVRLV